MDKYVLKAFKSGDEWVSEVSVSSLRENSGTNIKCYPRKVYTTKSAVFLGETQEQVLEYAKKWAEEQSL